MANTINPADPVSVLLTFIVVASMLVCCVVLILSTLEFVELRSRQTKKPWAVVLVLSKAVAALFGIVCHVAAIVGYNFPGAKIIFPSISNPAGNLGTSSDFCLAITRMHVMGYYTASWFIYLFLFVKSRLVSPVDGLTLVHKGTIVYIVLLLAGMVFTFTQVEGLLLPVFKGDTGPAVIGLALDRKDSKDAIHFYCMTVGLDFLLYFNWATDLIISIILLWLFIEPLIRHRSALAQLNLHKDGPQGADPIAAAMRKNIVAVFIAVGSTTIFYGVACLAFQFKASSSFLFVVTANMGACVNITINLLCMYLVTYTGKKRDPNKPTDFTNSKTNFDKSSKTIKRTAFGVSTHDPELDEVELSVDPSKPVKPMKPPKKSMVTRVNTIDLNLPPIPRSHELSLELPRLPGPEGSTFLPQQL